MIEERTAWLGRFVGGLVGMAWTLASTLLAFTLDSQRRGARHICGCPLPLRQDQRRLGRLPAGRLLDGVAAEALTKNRYTLKNLQPIGSIKQMAKLFAKISNNC
jgi:hypothetical protein